MLNPERSLNARFVDRLGRNPLLRDAAAKWQPVVQRALATFTPFIRDLLHGTPLGHSLHTSLSDVPVGAWTAAVALDAAACCGVRSLNDGADGAIVVGLAAAMATAATGWTDWSDTKDETRTLGMGHAMGAGVTIALFGASLALRVAGARAAGIAASAAGFGTLLFTGYAGGELAQGMQLGAKHTAEPLEPPREFVTVGSLTELRAESVVHVQHQGLRILLVREGSEVHAVAGICSHRGAPLGDLVEDGCIVCPWHSSRFRANDGSVERGPATFPLARYETRVVGDEIQVRAFTPTDAAGAPTSLRDGTPA
jgi:nitrite reductase/ring-hydroxylating ferredoxin subunit/uncharacterized membrane protein